MIRSLGHRLKEKIEDKVDKRFYGLKWKGTIELENKNRFLQIAPDLCSGRISDALHNLVGLNSVHFELVGNNIDPDTEKANRSGKERMKCKANLTGGQMFTVSFRVAKDFGEPAALLVESDLPTEFLLQHVTLKRANYVHHFEFPCHSWIYNSRKYRNCPRIFFSTKAYLPMETPKGLRTWRKEALKQLRGETGNSEGINGERAEHDRVYDYDVYNDLGNPNSKDADLSRKVLGGSSELPYPRRCRTGYRLSESPNKLSKLYYVPRDEQFDNSKNNTVTFNGIKSFIPYVLPNFLSKVGDIILADEGSLRPCKFSSLRDIFKLYSKKSEEKSGSSSIKSKLLEVGESVHLISKTVKQLLEDPRGYLLKFSIPQIVQAPNIERSKEWKADEEFGRQTLAGVNPIVIERVKELPKDSHLATQLNGRRLDNELSVTQAIAQNRLYIVDYFDAFLPFVEKTNELDDSKMYASRTVFFLTKDGTLKPIAVELSVSEKDGDSRVFFPPVGNSEQGWLWNLAKAHATINDAAYHELISHWLRTHACMEPFIIATNRTLSALHPINVLLAPHFKDTLQINALARQLLINAHKRGELVSGIIEMGFCTDRYSMEFSSLAYKNWRLEASVA